MFPSIRSMYGAWREFARANGRNREAQPSWMRFDAVAAWSSPKKGSSLRGIAMFKRPGLNEEIVSHEMTHLATFWCGHTGQRRVFGDHNEKLAEVQGHLTGQFWKRYRKLTQ